MNAEEYYRKKDYPILDKFDKKAAKFDYYDFIGFAESYHKAKLNLLNIPDVIASAKFEKDLEKAIEEGNEVGCNADGGYSYYSEGTVLREVLKVINKHLL